MERRLPGRWEQIMAEAERLPEQWRDLLQELAEYIRSFADRSNQPSPAGASAGVGQRVEVEYVEAMDDRPATDTFGQSSDNFGR